MEEVQQERAYQIQMASATLNDAVNQIYAIEGDRWQMAYDTLEAVLSNLQIENPKIQSTIIAMVDLD